MVATDMGTRGPAAGGGVRSWRGHGDGEGEGGGRDAKKRGQLRRRNSVDSTRVRALPHSSAVFDAGALRGNPKKLSLASFTEVHATSPARFCFCLFPPPATSKLFYSFFLRST